MLEVRTKDGKVTTFGSEYVWYKDRITNQLVVYKDLVNAKYFELDDIVVVYVGEKEVKING